jgi:hypothetical protein
MILVMKINYLPNHLQHDAPVIHPALISKMFKLKLLTS